MKVLIDHQIFISQRYGGISRYFSILLKNSKDYSLSLVRFLSINAYLNDTLVGRTYNRSKGRLRSVIYLLIRSINVFVSSIHIVLGRFDIYHPTYYGTFGVRYLRNKRLVVTVHDMYLVGWCVHKQLVSILCGLSGFGN